MQKTQQPQCHLMLAARRRGRLGGNPRTGMAL
jgi:hypothetical protein